MDQLSRHEIYIPENAEVKKIALQSLPRSLLTRMGLYPSNGDSSRQLTDSPEGIWISPAFLRSKGQKLVLDTRNSLSEHMSSKISREFCVPPDPIQMSFVTSNRAARKVLLDTINGVKVTASDLPPVLARKTYQIAVIIYQGRIYLSIRKPSQSQRQGETHEAPTTSRLATPSTSGTSSSSQRKSFGSPAESSWLKPAPHHISDHLLRRIFGITSDVKICLQRIDEASAGSLAKHHYSESTQADVQHQEPVSKVHEEELFLSELHSPPDSHSGSISVKSEEELSVDSLTSHTFTGPLKCSHMEAKRKQRNFSGQSDAETEALLGYMEPIDGDFISMDEEHKQDITDRTQEKKKRIGRTRKRTICPCCVSGAQNQALKLSLKTVFPGKKSGAKTARKRVKTSGKIRCPTSKKRGSSLCSSSGDSDEVKCQEEIRHLRELLREKEEALELLRRNTNT